MNTTTRSRAPKGGTIAKNGEFYEGGKWLPSTTNPKRAGHGHKATGRQEIEPYVWAEPPAPGARAILRRWAEFAQGWRSGPLTPFYRPQVYEYYGVTLEQVQEICRRWNAGERWDMPTEPQP